MEIRAGQDRRRMVGRHRLARIDCDRSDLYQAGTMNCGTIKKTYQIGVVGAGSRDERLFAETRAARPRQGLQQMSAADLRRVFVQGSGWFRISRARQATDPLPSAATLLAEKADESRLTGEDPRRFQRV